MRRELHVNWYKSHRIILAAGGITSEVVNAPDGTPYLCLFGNTFVVKDKISAAGFRWNPQRKTWFIDARVFATNQRAQSALQALGVPFNVGGVQNAPAPVQQQNPVQPKNWYDQSIKGRQWELATYLSDNKPVALSKNPENQDWTWTTQDGKTGVFTEVELQSVVKSVLDSGGRKITATDPSELFKIFDSMNGGVQPQNAPGAAQAGKGRIPEDKISPYQKAIEGTYLNTNKDMMVSALAGTGKAQPLDAKLLTPNGWVYMGDIQVGDEVFGSDGMPHKVIGVFPQGEKEVFEIEFTDGSKTEACDEHIWTTETKYNRDRCRFYKEALFSRSANRTTKEIRNDLLHKGRPKHYIPLVSPVEFAYKETEIEPYLMGVLLGDGCFRQKRSVTYSNIDQEIIASVNSNLPYPLRSVATGSGYDYRIAGMQHCERNLISDSVDRLGLRKTSSQTKFIPDQYKFNDVSTRLAVLQGLLDTDGYISEGTAEYCTTSPHLAKDVEFLVQSLGGTAKTTTRITKYTYKGLKKNGKLSYRVYIKLPKEFTPFRLTRKIAQYVPSTKYHARRAIKNITSVGVKECQCISIDSFNNLYVTDNCILTHNTTVLRHLASFKPPGQKWLYLVFNTKNKIEAKEKFPPDIDVETSHAFLGKVLGKNSELGVTQHTDLWRDKGERISAILDNVMERDDVFPQNLRYGAKTVIKRVASLSKAFAIDPQQPDAVNHVNEIINKYAIDCDLSTDKIESNVDWRPHIVEKVLDLLHACLPGNTGNPQFEGQRDHDDTLWYAAINKQIVFPKYDMVLADEVQDFNRCQSYMLQKLSQAGARVVAVGDENQALYSFRGADAQAFSGIRGILDASTNGSQPHDLPVNYRSGRKIIEYVNQNTHVKNLKAGRDFDGEVTQGTKYTDAVGGIVNEAQLGGGKLKEQTAFIARTNSPLVKSALNLMKSNIDFAIIGKDFSGELIKHIEKISGKGRFAKRIAITELTDNLLRYQYGLQKKWGNKISKANELKEIKETTESLTDVIQYLEASGFRDQKTNMQVNDTVSFIEFLRRRFSGVDMDKKDDADAFKKKDPRSFVTLTTAHKSKGLEFDRVYVLEPKLFPHPKAKTAEEKQQEANAWYVTLTRAMKELHILANEEGVEKKDA